VGGAVQRMQGRRGKEGERAAWFYGDDQKSRGGKGSGGFESRQVHCMEKGLTARLKVRCDHMLKTRDWKRKKLPVVLLLVKITNMAIAYH